MPNEKILAAVRDLRPVAWKAPLRPPAGEVLARQSLGLRDVREAEARLDRFAPLVRRLFPETKDGIIESPLRRIDAFAALWGEETGRPLQGRFFAKADNMLRIAGSIKARGGIYEVLSVAERIALQTGFLEMGENYARMGDPRGRELFGRYHIAVGSTGNLGISIGTMAAAMGFRATVHMSQDAKQWKKDLLRERGAAVVEYAEDYSKAVEAGRLACHEVPGGHFVDDERSLDLFLGYAVAALRLKGQLDEAGVTVDGAHPLLVYLPCGVGGAPGGITFGLKLLFGDAVRCFFVEPTHAPCMTLALLLKNPHLSVKDFGIDGITEADGLAVGAPSALVYDLVGELVDGAYTVEDEPLYRLVELLWSSEGLKAEPSAVSSLWGPLMMGEDRPGVTHLAWLTGGLLIPENIFATMRHRGEHGDRLRVPEGL